MTDNTKSLYDTFKRVSQIDNLSVDDDDASNWTTNLETALTSTLPLYSSGLGSHLQSSADLCLLLEPLSFTETVLFSLM